MLTFEVLTSTWFCPQSANVHRKAHTAAYATHCRVSVCVSQGWWASSVIAVPLDSGSPSAQVTTSGTIILMI